jgi:hypothetical protein
MRFGEKIINIKKCQWIDKDRDRWIRFLFEAVWHFICVENEQERDELFEKIWEALNG